MKQLYFDKKYFARNKSSVSESSGIKTAVDQPFVPSPAPLSRTRSPTEPLPMDTHAEQLPGPSGPCKKRNRVATEDDSLPSANQFKPLPSSKLAPSSLPDRPRPVSPMTRQITYEGDYFTYSV